MNALHNRLIPILFATLTLIQGCGGGGGSDSPAATSTTGTSTTSTSTTGTSTTDTSATSNVHPISVDGGLAGAANLAFTSVTLCVPNSLNCQTINNIVVDTGSSGLRIMFDALPAALLLPQQNNAGGDPVLECAHFADGFFWGPVKLTDLIMTGELANSLPIQVIGDPQFAAVPSRCSATGRPISSKTQLRANGILGLGVFRQDCGNACATSLVTGTYYACPATGCQPALTAASLQVQQPVSMFAADNNGVVIELPSVPAAGAASVSGNLVFGIGTRANNALGAASVIKVDPSTANFTTTFNSTSYTASFIDSGSNAFFFQDALIDVCPDGIAGAGFYCPAPTFSGTAIIQDASGGSATVNFNLASAAALFAGNPGFMAFGNLGGPLGTAAGFDWGLPFFFGRNVYTAIEGAVTPGGPTGPYVAF